VEVVGGRLSSADAIEKALAFYKSIGKKPIHIRREVKGYVANRLQTALWREAFYLVEQGIASVEDVDTAIANGPGLRWALLGPFLNLHMSGGAGGIAHVLEHLGPPIESWWRDLGDVTLNVVASCRCALRSVHNILADFDHCRRHGELCNDPSARLYMRTLVRAPHISTISNAMREMRQLSNKYRKRYDVDVGQIVEQHTHNPQDTYVSRSAIRPMSGMCQEQMFFRGDFRRRQSGLAGGGLDAGKLRALPQAPFVGCRNTRTGAKFYSYRGLRMTLI
jgi:hypothetical protein